MQDALAGFGPPVRPPLGHDMSLRPILIGSAAVFR